MSLDTLNAMTRLAGPANAANGTSTILTVPSGHLYSIRSIRIVNNTAASITYKLGIGGVTDALLILPAIAVGPGVAYHETGLFVMSAAETLQVNASATGGTITVSGLDQS